MFLPEISQLCWCISNDHGNRTAPSYVSFSVKERLIGDAAKIKSQYEPSRKSSFVIFIFLFVEFEFVVASPRSQVQ